MNEKHTGINLTSLLIRHLNGSINDSFNLYVDNIFWDSYDGENGTEDWYVHTYTGTPGSVLRLDVTVDDPAWRELWGQLAIDSVEANTIPEPATIALPFLFYRFYLSKHGE
ncbi:MAG: hypothetical protein JXB29_04310 [Sedimentisphaerales bacterium]|nr:hypothetical protein [Sedimentisphaerales bacterium]